MIVIERVVNSDDLSKYHYVVSNKDGRRILGTDIKDININKDFNMHIVDWDTAYRRSLNEDYYPSFDMVIIDLDEKTSYFSLPTIRKYDKTIFVPFIVAKTLVGEGIVYKAIDTNGNVLCRVYDKHLPMILHDSKRSMHPLFTIDISDKDIEAQASMVDISNRLIKLQMLNTIVGICVSRINYNTLFSNCTYIKDKSLMLEFRCNEHKKENLQSMVRCFEYTLSDMIDSRNANTNNSVITYLFKHITIGA